MVAERATVLELGKDLRRRIIPIGYHPRRADVFIPRADLHRNAEMSLNAPDLGGRIVVNAVVDGLRPTGAIAPLNEDLRTKVIIPDAAVSNRVPDRPHTRNTSAQADASCAPAEPAASTTRLQSKTTAHLIDASSAHMAKVILRVPEWKRLMTTDLCKETNRESVIRHSPVSNNRRWPDRQFSISQSYENFWNPDRLCGLSNPCQPDRRGFVSACLWHLRGRIVQLPKGWHRRMCFDDSAQCADLRPVVLHCRRSGRHACFLAGRN